MPCLQDEVSRMHLNMILASIGSKVLRMKQKGHDVDCTLIYICVRVEA